MNIKTNLLVENVKFVDNTKKKNNFLWICMVLLVFIAVILTIIMFSYNLYSEIS